MEQQNSSDTTEAKNIAVVIKKVSKTYDLGNTTVKGLASIDLQIQKGEFLALAGASGSGKTTLLNIIGCIEKPTSGEVIINGTSVNQLTEDELANLRLNHLGFIFQNFNLLPILSAVENVAYPFSMQNPRMTTTERNKTALDLLISVGLGDYHDHKPMQLSGGQRQRVAIARALITRPNIILADEPTANLDAKTGSEILRLMKQLNKELKTTFIFSTHDPKVISIADRVVNISDGNILRDEASCSN